MIKVILALLIMVALVIFIQHQRKAIQCTEYVIEDERLPEAFDGVRILQVADIQSEYFGRDQSRLLETAADCNPDYIVMTGDLADRNHTNIKASLTAMQGLSGMAPVYYVNGNHEMRLSEENADQLYDGLEALGVEKLFDRGTLIERDDQCISICGLSEFVIYAAKEDDHELYRETDTAKIKEMADQLAEAQWAHPGVFNVLLTHEPQYLEVFDNPGFAVAFTGHAHGGQFRLPVIGGLFAPGQGWFPKYTAGVYQGKWTQMVVSRGLGNSTFPIRLFNRPELVIVTLKRKEHD